MTDLNDVTEVITEPVSEAEEVKEDMADAISEETGIPEWAIIPDNLKLPNGRSVYYMRFKAKWTSSMHKGDRHCILWSLTDAEENTAADRCKNAPHRFIKEGSKIMIRAFDGTKANWTKDGKPGDVQTFWEEIGPRGRGQINSLYIKIHSLSGEDVIDFLGSCVGVSTALG